MHGCARILYDIIQRTTMTFVPNRFSVWYKGHFPRWRVQYVMHVICSCIYLYKLQAPPKNPNPLWKLCTNPLWNPEIHFEIQKSNLKSTWYPVDFKISYAEMRRDGPLAKTQISIQKLSVNFIDQSLLIIAKFVDTRVRHIFNLVRTISS